MASVSIDCRDCGGTGVYHGFAEPDGVGAVCTTCKGSGEEMMKYTPFTGRRNRSDIKFVGRSSGQGMWSKGTDSGKLITYQEFLNGKMPPS